MAFNLFKSRLTHFARDTSGSAMVECVVTLPLMILLLAATYEFFEAQRYRSVRDKASYTIADMISREQGEGDDVDVHRPEEFITDAYIDNSLRLFDDMTNDDGTNQIRLSMLQFNAGKGVNGEYEASWSEVRGTGNMLPLTDADVANDHDVLPVRSNGQFLILVESQSEYNPIFEVGFNEGMTIGTRVFTDLRFAPELRYFPADADGGEDPRDNEEPEED